MIRGPSYCSMKQLNRSKFSLCKKKQAAYVFKLYAPFEKNAQCESRRCIVFKEVAEEGEGGKRGKYPPLHQSPPYASS